MFSRRKRQVRLSAFKLNRPVLLLGAVTLLLLCCGLWSVYRSDVNSAEKIEGQPVFSGLADKINMVEKIVLRNHDHELNFYKKDGVWMLDNPADVPVYQARIRSFLSALLEARYYERKTANAEHLRRFDLNPVAEDGSKNLRIELQSAQGNVIEGFEVGRFVVDIGWLRLILSIYRPTGGNGPIRRCGICALGVWLASTVLIMPKTLRF